MYAYRNLNTNQVVERPERSARFDNSPSWTLVSQPADDLTPAPEKPQSPPAQPGSEHVPDELPAGAVEVPAVPTAAEDDPAPATPRPAKPARSASRLEWAEYALTQGADPARVADMKRDELVAEFGR